MIVLNGIVMFLYSALRLLAGLAIITLVGNEINLECMKKNRTDILSE